MKIDKSLLGCSIIGNHITGSKAFYDIDAQQGGLWDKSCLVAEHVKSKQQPYSRVSTHSQPREKINDFN
jgi:hypothetical protein